MPAPFRRFFRALKIFSVALLLVTAALLIGGADLLISTDPVPAHADAAVVLQGSMAGEMARLPGAMAFLQRGIADRVLVSIPEMSYWGQSLPPVARAYLERTYGSALAERVDFCETGDEVNSTEQEARVVLHCIRDHGWHSIIVVTSDYHTRRAGILWRRAMREMDPQLSLSVESVADPEFQKPWWRHRLSAKVWISESSKLAWTTLGGE